MSTNPKISIICSVFNREKYLEQCINSILNQTLSDFELILINNGSNDSSGALIEQYAKKDSRIITIHNNNGTTYGTALNQGIKLARGEYIGIVESDDWIDRTMYEKLYNKIVEFDADIALCSFKRHLPDGRIVNETGLLNKSSDLQLFSIKDNPELLRLHPSIWAKLYKKNVFNQILFDEKDKYLDQQFNITLLSSFNKLISVKEFLYNYRQNNIDASSSINRKDNSYIEIIDSFIKAKNIAKELDLYQTYKEEMIHHATYVIIGWYYRINKNFQKKYLKKAFSYFKELKEDKTFLYKYFNQKEKIFINNLLNKNFKYIEATSYKKISFVGINIFECVQYSNITKYKIIGFTYKKELIVLDNCETFLLKNLIKIEKNKNFIKFYLLKICIYSNYNLTELIKDNNNIIVNRVKLLLNTQLTRAIEVCSLHQKVFPKYRNINIGKDIVVVGAGPTLNFYNGMENCIHIGVNKVFKYNKIDLDYSFLLDYNVGCSYIKELNKYRQGKCCKFYGQLLENYHPYSIPEIEAVESSAERYYVNESNYNMAEEFLYDISTQPLPCFFSVIFQALSFALWTNPKRIYLVGCDSDFSGHYDDTPMASDHPEWQRQHRNRNMDGWNKFQKFTRAYYPNTEIISINPIGLKGRFKDIYTKEYLEKTKN